MKEMKELILSQFEKNDRFMTTQEFVEKYEIGVSFEEMYTIRENIKSKLKFANSFLLGGLKKEKYTKEQENYLDGLKFMLSKYMELYSDWQVDLSEWR